MKIGYDYFTILSTLTLNLDFFFHENSFLNEEAKIIKSESLLQFLPFIITKLNNPHREYQIKTSHPFDSLIE